MSEPYEKGSLSLNAPLQGAFAITPDDATLLPQHTRQLRITTGGDLRVEFISGVVATIPVWSQDVIDLRVVRVFATGTTATGIYGFY